LAAAATVAAVAPVITLEEWQTVSAWEQKFVD
jgi:hypothetical protein